VEPSTVEQTGPTLEAVGGDLSSSFEEQDPRRGQTQICVGDDVGEMMDEQQP